MKGKVLDLEGQSIAARDAARTAAAGVAALEAAHAATAARLDGVAGTLPVLAGELKALEEDVRGKASAAAAQLHELGAAMINSGHVPAQQGNKSPFGGITQGKEQVRQLEARLEGMRNALFSSARDMAHALSAGRDGSGRRSPGSAAGGGDGSMQGGALPSVPSTPMDKLKSLGNFFKA